MEEDKGGGKVEIRKSRETEEEKGGKSFSFLRSRLFPFKETSCQAIYMCISEQAIKAQISNSVESRSSIAHSFQACCFSTQHRDCP